MGSRVLAKQKNQIWHRCVVLQVPEKEDEPYRVKFESSGTIFEVLVQDLLPLGEYPFISIIFLIISSVRP